MQGNNWCFDSKIRMFFFFPHELVVVVSTKVLVGIKNRHTPNNFTSGVKWLEPEHMIFKFGLESTRPQGGNHFQILWTQHLSSTSLNHGSKACFHRIYTFYLLYMTYEYTCLVALFCSRFGYKSHHICILWLMYPPKWSMRQVSNVKRRHPKGSLFKDPGFFSGCPDVRFLMDQSSLRMIWYVSQCKCNGS